jgi:hypothetical protein
MIRIFVRRSPNLDYLTGDPARELEGLREGPAWWRPDGRGPVDLRRLDERLRTTSRSRVVGYDLVIAAPRPVSILLALDETRAPDVVRAHREAVSAALSYVDERAAVVRTRRGGHDEEVASSWDDGVSFTHGVNRHGEPHLHDHLVLPAVARSEKSINDPRSLFAHAVAADAVYRASLRSLVHSYAGYRVWRSPSGREGVEGMDEGWLALWGGHWAERGSKVLWGRDEIRDRWRDQARRVELFGEMRSPARREGVDPHLYRAALYGDRWPTRRDLVRAVADGAREGLRGGEVAVIVDRSFPELRDDRGLRERPISLSAAWERAPVHSLVLERESGPSRVSPSRVESRERGGDILERDELHRGSR